MHSPAPWRVIRSSEYTEDSEDTTIQSIDAADGKQVYYTESGYFKPREEDVALIVAAPLLLESLRDIVTFLHNHKNLPQGNLFHMNAAALLARLEEANAAI